MLEFVLVISFFFLIVFYLVHSKSEFKPARDPGVYDVSNESCSWLQYFRAMNSKQLEEVQIHTRIHIYIYILYIGLV